MTEKERRQKDAETYVTTVLRETFKQKVSAATVKTVAAKVSRSIPKGAPRQHLEAAE